MLKEYHAFNNVDFLIYTFRERIGKYRSKGVLYDLLKIKNITTTRFNIKWDVDKNDDCKSIPGTEHVTFELDFDYNETLNIISPIHHQCLLIQFQVLNGIVTLFRSSVYATQYKGTAIGTVEEFIISYTKWKLETT